MTGQNLILSAPYWIWKSVGSPTHPDCIETPLLHCWICAGPAHRSLSRSNWLGPTFTGQNRVRCPSSNVICEPCAFVHSRSFPVPGRPAKDGKQPPNWRNYSVLVEIIDGMPLLQTATKAEKTIIRSFLTKPKNGSWFAAIADSGQKHIIPTCPVNPKFSRGKIMLEETEISLPIASEWELVIAIDEFLTQGASKDAIESGTYSVLQWQQIPTIIDTFEETWGGLRNSSFFGLALWLAQRDDNKFISIQNERKQKQKENIIAITKRTNRAFENVNSQSVTQSQERISNYRSESAQTLGTVTKPCQTSSQIVNNSGRVVQQYQQEVISSIPKQLPLF